jgi:hypothetical protein
VIVGADGVHSAVRTSLSGQQAKTLQAALKAYEADAFNRGTQALDGSLNAAIEAHG